VRKQETFVEKSYLRRMEKGKGKRKMNRRTLGV
jgi:hypothetical protein